MTTKNTTLIELELDSKKDPYTKSTLYMFDKDTTETELLRQSLDILSEFRYHYVMTPTGRRSDGTNILIVPEERQEINVLMTRIITYIDKCIERLEVRKASQ